MSLNFDSTLKYLMIFFFFVNFFLKIQKLEKGLSNMYCKYTVESPYPEVLHRAICKIAVSYHAICKIATFYCRIRKIATFYRVVCKVATCCCAMCKVLASYCAIWRRLVFYHAIRKITIYAVVQFQSSLLSWNLQDSCLSWCSLQYNCLLSSNSQTRGFPIVKFARLPFSL